jgi:Domain of unknown function DUF29
MPLVDATLYETDFEAWVQQQADLCKQKRFEELDLAHLVEEIESLGKSERRAIASYLTVLLTHLLKWQYQPEGQQYTSDGRPKGSWAGSITYSRIQIQKLLEDSPSLHNYINTVITNSYQDAVKVAVRETGLEQFPNECPFTIDQILNPDWFPE